MIEKFKKFIKDNNLASLNHQILLAVSGGPDSVVMLDLFSKSGFNFAISHVNFKLRGKDSDDDENFVRNLAKKYEVEIFVSTFDTEKYANENGISIEMAARELRYNEFEKIMINYNYNFTAVAHHKDDAIETFLLNLTRGTGIRGLTGIRKINGKIIRPMLCFSRSEIETYISENQLQYRIDKTNFETNYTRNKIRNTIIPLFEQINPSFKDSLTETVEYLSQVKQIYFNEVEWQKKNIVSKENDCYLISIQKLQQNPQPECIIYEILRDFDFNKSQISQILKSFDSESGKTFYSSRYRLIKDRNCLIINELTKTEKSLSSILIDKNIIEQGKFSLGSIHLEFQIIKNNKNFKPNRDLNVSYFDYNKIKFPLELRNWQNGDWFVPFGKNQKKKLSDFFIDNKLNINKKETIKLLCSENNIIWLVGLRSDNRYRVTPDSQDILKITLKYFEDKH